MNHYPKMPDLLCLKDYEQHAERVMDKRFWAFFSQGAEREQTLRENERAFQRFKLIPRMLRNSSERDLHVSVLGERLSFPVALAPTAYQRLAHADGEIAAARAAARAGTLYTLSSASTAPLEEVARCAPSAPKWMQLYVLKDRGVTERMIHRAEENGYRALVLTVDAPVMGLRLRVQRTGITLPPHLKASNLDDCKTEGMRDIVNVPHLCDTLTWEDVDWIRSISRLPLVLKGILTAEDAALAVQHGAAAVWVSNHGGRQVDGTDTALDVLGDVTKALEGSGCEVYADGGVRWGTDVFKMLALGARAVFIGRPILWGLARAGEEGVNDVLEILKSELNRTMHLMGGSSALRWLVWVLSEKYGNLIVLVQAGKVHIVVVRPVLQSSESCRQHPAVETERRSSW